MNYKRLMRIEGEMKILLEHRLAAYEFDHIVVETYYALDMRVMCRIEIFVKGMEIEHRLFKYEAYLQEGFYFEAEQRLKKTLCPASLQNAS